MLVAGSASIRPVAAQDAAEYKVKLAYLYKIAIYVNHGEATGLTSGKTLRIGIMGKDPFGPLLDRLASRRNIHNRPIEIKRFPKPDSLTDCDLLFVSKEVVVDASLRDHIRRVCGDVLVVGDTLGLERRGGVFCMYLDDEGRVGLRLNVDEAKRGRFRVDARLMQICDVVRDDIALNQSNKNE